MTSCRCGFVSIPATVLYDRDLDRGTETTTVTIQFTKWRETRQNRWLKDGKYDDYMLAPVSVSLCTETMMI